MMWFLLFLKRNLKHLSFVLILACIPFFCITLNEFSKRDTSIVNVGYVGEKPFSKNSEIIKFTEYGSEEDGKTALLNREIDTLWCFGEKARIINLEETEITKLTREKLFCLIYPSLSETLFKEYVRENISGGDTLSNEELDSYYSYKDVNTHIVDIVTIDADGNERESRDSIVMSPVRGLLSVIVMLSALTAALYTLKDRKRGMFSLFYGRKKVFLTMQSILAALVPASLFFIISLYFTGIWEGLYRELLGVVVLVITSLSFTLLLATVTRLSVFTLILPVLTVASLFISPVFLNSSSFSVIQLIFPTYYYLYSFSDSSVFLSAVVYSALMTLLAFLSEKLKRC